MKAWAMIIGLVVGVLASFVASAASATVSWVNPTQYTDGTALAATEITRTRVEWGTCSGTAFGTKSGELSTTGAATSITISGLGVGTWCFRAYTTAKGLESSASATVTKTILPAPKPPTSVAAK